MSVAAGAHTRVACAVTLPAEVRAGIEAELGVRITNVAGVSGGCISPAFRLTCGDGSSIFVKTTPADGADDMLAQEAVSLGRIADTDTVRVPRVLASGGGWLALEWLEPTGGDGAEWAALGSDVARLHRSSSDRYGWDSANYIGSLSQSNDWTGDWASFWRRQRLEPQLNRAKEALGPVIVGRFQRLHEELYERLRGASADGPSLLHGDLWAGNVHFTVEGGAVIDPSSAYGHREVDLAMAALFGGFPPSFFDAYAAEWPLVDGADERRGIYQLYYLLVHVNLFGGSYVARTRSVLESVLSTPA